MNSTNYSPDADNSTEEDSKEMANSEEKRPGSKRKAMRGKDYLKSVFAINTSMCRSELELIQHVIFQNGFMETTLTGAGNLYWFGLGLTDKDCKLV